MAADLFITIPKLYHYRYKWRASIRRDNVSEWVCSEANEIRTWPLARISTHRYVGVEVAVNNCIFEGGQRSKIGVQVEDVLYAMR